MEDLTVKDVARFFKHVSHPKNPLSCHNWTGAKFAGGYGMFYLKREICTYAHKVAYEIKTGVRPGNRVAITHTCKNAVCVNPEHLKPRRRDEIRPNAILSKRDVKKIRQLYGNGRVTQFDLGQLFSVSQSTISRIVNNHSWTDI